MIGMIFDLFDGTFQKFYREHGLRWALYVSRARTLALGGEVTADWVTGIVTGRDISGDTFVIRPVHREALLTTVMKISINGGPERTATVPLPDPWTRTRHMFWSA
jgi:hypothetical protein